VTWERRMSEQAAQRERFAVLDFLNGVDPAWRDNCNYSATAPEDGTCRECFEWRRFPDGQEHFGFAWWRTCGRDCGHEHHKDEEWVA
jgi:hypothetical protein